MVPLFPGDPRDPMDVNNPWVPGVSRVLMDVNIPGIPRDHRVFNKLKNTFFKVVQTFFKIFRLVSEKKKVSSFFNFVFFFT